MKRFAATLLVLCVLLPAAVMADTPTSDMIADAITTYLNSLEYTFDYDTENHRFTYSMSLDSTIRECDVSIFVQEDGFNVYAYSPIGPRRDDEKTLAEVAGFITRVNYTLNLGNFEMDYSDGELRYKTAVQCFDSIPTQKEIEWLVDIPALMIEKYGDGLAKIILMGVDAAEAFAPYEKK